MAQVNPSVSVGAAAPRIKSSTSFSGVGKGTPSGLRAVEVLDVKKIKEFRAQKERQARQEQLATEKRIRQFEKERGLQLQKQKEARVKEFAGRGRVLEKPKDSRLTQGRISPSTKKVRGELGAFEVQAAKDIQKKSQEEFQELNKSIQELNKEIASYKPMTKEFVSSFSYSDPKDLGKPISISFDVGKEFEKESIKLKQLETDVPGYFATIAGGKAEGYTALKPLAESDVQIGLIGEETKKVKKRLAELDKEFQRTKPLDYSKYFKSAEQLEIERISRPVLISELKVQPIEDRITEAIRKADIEARAFYKRNSGIRTGISPLDDIFLRTGTGATFVTELGVGYSGISGRENVIARRKRAIDLTKRLDTTSPSYQLSTERLNLGMNLDYPGQAFLDPKTSEQLSIMSVGELESRQRTSEEASRLFAQTAPYFTPFMPVKVGLDIAQSKSLEELGMNIGFGLASGGLFKFLGKTGELTPLLAARATGATAKVTKTGIKFTKGTKNVAGEIPFLLQKTIPSIEKYGVPLTFAGVGAVGTFPALQAARLGDTKQARRIERELARSFAGISIGSKVGGFLGTQFQRPIQKQILKETGRLSFTGKERDLFLEQFEYVYKTLPKKEIPLKEFKARELEILGEFSPKVAKKISKITEKTLGEFGAEIIGSSVIVPQTTLRRTPKGKVGDIDVAKISEPKFVAERLAYDVGKVLPKGYTAKVYPKQFQGTQKYMVSILKGGKRLSEGKNLLEFVNIGTSLRPTARQFDLFEQTPFKIPEFTFRTTKGGAKVLSLTSQAKAKLYGGYFGGRQKDLKDLAGIITGTKRLPEKFVPFKTKITSGVKTVLPGLRQSVGFKIKDFLMPISQRGKSFVEKSYYDAPRGKGQQYYSKYLDSYAKTYPLYGKEYSQYFSKSYLNKYYKQAGYNVSGYPISYQPAIYKQPYTPKYTPPYQPAIYKQPYTPKYTPPYQPTIYAPPYVPPRTPPPKRPPARKKDFEEDLFSQEKQATYYPYIREKGKWRKASNSPFTKNRAWFEGQMIADNTTATTISIKPSGKTTYLQDAPNPLPGKFRKKAKKSKITKNPVWIERNQNRIDTIGEKQQLSAARYLAQMNRVMF